MKTKKKHNRKTLKGGRKYGTGFKGSVMDLCNYKKHDAFNLCKQLKKNEINNITIYVKKEKKQIEKFILETESYIEKFIDFIKSPATKNYVVKEFYNYKIKDIDFQNEIQSYETISNIITEKENIIGIQYDSKILIGFEIQYKESVPQIITNELYSLLQNNPFDGISDFIHEKINKRLFVINRKCQKTLNTKYVNTISVSTFKKFVIEILDMIIKLNEINIAHGDIKLDNIMICNNKFSLIDWEQSRKLNYYDLKVNLSMGSCPVYYIIKFGYLWESIHAIAIPFIINVTNCNDRDSKISSQYIFNGLKYYKEIFQSNPHDVAFEKVKNSLDLYSFGLILYGILEHNKNIQNDSKYNLYQEFVNKIYKYENPIEALIDFQSII